MTPSGHTAIIGVRMEALKLAIIQRDWQQVEWEYDRVLRAIAKLEREDQTK